MGYPKEKIVPLTDEQRKTVEENHNLIYKVINDCHLDPDEWYDVAAIGLCQAAQRFDPNAGFQFSTYAYKSIYYLICRQHSLDKVQHRTPPGGGLLYLEDKYGNFVDSERLIDLVPANSNSFVDDIIVENDFKRTLSKMKPRDQEIILKVAEGYTYQQAGEMFGLSRERVRQVIVRYGDRIGYKKKKKYNRRIK